jgi:hypothetical protein
MRTADPTIDSITAGRGATRAAVEVLGVTQRVQGRTTLHDVSFRAPVGPWLSPRASRARPSSWGAR